MMAHSSFCWGLCEAHPSCSLISSIPICSSSAHLTWLNRQLFTLMLNLLYDSLLICRLRIIFLIKEISIKDMQKSLLGCALSLPCLDYLTLNQNFPLKLLTVPTSAAATPDEVGKLDFHFGFVLLKHTTNLIPSQKKSVFPTIFFLCDHSETWV